MKKYKRKILVRQNLGHLEADFFNDFYGKGWELDPEADNGTIAAAFAAVIKKDSVSMFIRREIEN